MIQLNRDKLIEKITQVIFNNGKTQITAFEADKLAGDVLKALGEHLPAIEELHKQNLFVTDAWRELKNICEGK